MNPLPDPHHSKPPTRKASKRELIRALRDGLNTAGIRNRLRSSTILVGSDPVMAIRVNTLQPDLRLWRVTCGVLLPGSYSAIVNPYALTVHQGEFGPDTGPNLMRLLTERGWVWPIFADDPSYPTYAWSAIATRTLKAEQDRRAKFIINAILGRCAE